jgi:predicted nuclease with TOPRIM domain
LRAINAELWEIEDQLRMAENEKVFDETFVALARSVYRLNDRRSEIKRRMDRLAGSSFTEIKSYTAKRK